MKKIVAIAIFALMLALGCQPKQVVPETTSIVETQTLGNLRKEGIDLNNNKVADIWNYYSTEGTERLVRKETDLNFDGRRDIVSHYEEGKLVKEEVDSDFDGKFDWTDFYGDDGKRVRQEVDSDFDGNINIWKYFHDGKIIRKERDTDNNGQPDYFEYYENNEVKRIGRDTDGDGKEDHWDNLDVKRTDKKEEPGQTETP